MTARNVKKIDKREADIHETRRNNWEVMRPFVYFSFKALAVIGSALFAIVQMIPKMAEHKSDEKKSDKVIKI
jgi:hypothetical protein